MRKNLLQRTIATQKDLAGSWRDAQKRVGISHAYLLRLYTGERTHPSPETLAKLGLRYKGEIYEVIK